jgi:RNase H-fold protein (predicted Holliday junction resolvase)
MAATLYLGIDPGRDKTGLALVDTGGTIQRVQVVPTAALAGHLPEWAALAGQLIIGNGTHSEAVADLVRKLAPDRPLTQVDEKHSTEEARQLYWQLHPPEGLRRLWPLGLQVPPEPLDGYAAAILVRRYLAALG